MRYFTAEINLILKFTYTQEEWISKKRRNVCVCVSVTYLRFDRIDFSDAVSHGSGECARVNSGNNSIWFQQVQSNFLTFPSLLHITYNISSCIQSVDEFPIISIVFSLSCFTFFISNSMSFDMLEHLFVVLYSWKWKLSIDPLISVYYFIYFLVISITLHHTIGIESGISEM